jgi:hypothetical protein
VPFLQNLMESGKCGKSLWQEIAFCRQKTATFPKVMVFTVDTFIDGKASK